LPAFIPERKKVCGLGGASFIPQELTLSPGAKRFGRQLKRARGQKVIPLFPSGLCRPFLAV
jgi:hypothetical protein